MKSPQRVVWSEGLLMAPQHLQQQDRYHEEVLSARLEALDPLSWGVVEVELDARELSRGQVQLNRFVGVMPDGLVLGLEPGHPELPSTRPVEGHFPPAQAALEVYLAVPREKPGVDNYTSARDDSYRYTVETRSVRDMAGGGQEADVAFGCRNASLRFGDESREDFVSIKIAELVRDDAGGLLVSEPYIPPCLRIGASPFVLAGLRRLLGLMTNRHNALSEARRQSSASTIEYGASDVTRFLWLNTINGFLPVLKHMVDLADLPPRAAYLLLCQFAGQLATFSVDVDPAKMPLFAYTDLRSTFEPLFARLTSMLRATVEEHCVTLPLQARDDGMHVGQFEDDRLANCASFLIAVRSEMPEQQVATQLPRLSKVASWVDINNILDAATPGAAVEVTYRPPAQVPVKAGSVYFAIDTDNAYWRNIMTSRNVAVYLPLVFNPGKTQVQLLGVVARPETSSLAPTP